MYYLPYSFSPPPNFVFVRFIHVDVCNCSNQFSLPYSYPSYENSTGCLFPVDGHVGCFQFYAFANYLATNFLIHIPLCPHARVSVVSQLRAILRTDPSAPTRVTFDNVRKHFGCHN